MASLGVTLSILFSGMVFGHHSFAMFDRQITETLSGSLYSLEWKNPHSWIWVEAPDKDGNLVVWGFEGGTPQSFTRQGFTQDDLKEGMKVDVTFHPLKDGTHGGQFISMTFEDGRTVK